MNLLRKFNRKGTAFSVGAGNLYGTAHHGQQTVGDGKTESGALNLAVSFDVEAFEDVEQAIFIFFADTDAGIGYGGAQIERAFVAMAADVEGDGTRRGVFDGVVEEVYEDLAQAAGVPVEAVGQIRINVDLELQVFGLGAYAD